MKKSEKKKGKGRKALLWASGIAVLGLLYSVAVEPMLTINRRLEIGTGGTTPSATIKAIHFSDVHLGRYYSISRLEKLVEKINREQPDIVLFTGDLFDKARFFTQFDETASILKELQAPLGKYAVWGNHDYGGGGVRVYEKVLTEAGFTVLKNQSVECELPGGGWLQVSGLDDLKFGKPDYSILTQGDDADFHIVLAHAPDMAERIAPFQPDLILSGHSHGGQIAIPFIGPVYTPPGADNYKTGMHKLEDTLLYIENGVGTTGLPMRFGAFPGFTTLTITIE